MAKIVWYLLHYATTPTKGSRNRPYYLAKALQDLNCKPYVIAANSHHYLRQDIKVDDKFVLDTSDGVNYFWLKTPPYKKNGFRRILNMFYFGFALWRNAEHIKHITDKPDAIVVSSPHAFYFPIAKYIAKKYKAKLIFETRDLWPLALIQMNKKLKYNPLIMYMNWIEKNACKHADYIVSLLPNSFVYLKTRGLPSERYACIPNGFGLSEELTANEDCSTEIMSTLKSLQQQNKFLVGYLGTQGIFNALEQIIDALIILQKQGHTHIHVVLAGNGIKKEELKAKAAFLTNVTFLNNIPVTAAQHFLRQMDILFIGWHPLEIYNYGISPDKIFSYMLAGKPILHAINTIHDPSQMAGCAIVVTPDSPVELANAMLNTSQRPKEELQAMGQMGKDYVLAHHDYKVLAKKYLELI